MRQPIKFGTQKRAIVPVLQEKLNKFNCVAQFAKGRKETKAYLRLAIRIADWSKMDHTKMKHVMHKPGSMQ